MEDNRNVLDKYKGMSEEKIIEQIQENSFPFAFCMQQIQGDFNISNILRSANALGAREAFYIGKRQWDRRGAVGVQNYTRLKHLKDIGELQDLKSKYKFVALEQAPTSVPMTNFEWPENTLMIFGEESCGVDPEILKLADYIVEIPQFGSVRSLNAGTAAGVAMWDYVSKKIRK